MTQTQLLIETTTASLSITSLIDATSSTIAAPLLNNHQRKNSSNNNNSISAISNLVNNNNNNNLIIYHNNNSGNSNDHHHQKYQHFSQEEINFTKLFRKLFRNLVIFKTIISQVYQIHRRNKHIPTKCYNQIISVDWMVSNKYFALLHDKVKRKEPLYGWRYFHLDQLANAGQYDLLNFILYKPETNPLFTVSCMDNAAEGNNISIIKFLHQYRTEGCTSNAMDLASKNGNFKIVKWLHYNRTEGCTTNAMDNAAGNGHLEIVKWLHDNRTEGCTTNAIDSAAGNGHLEVVKFLNETKSLRCTEEGFISAASHGHLEVIQFLWEVMRIPIGFSVFLTAATYGHLDVLCYISVNIAIGNPEFTQENYYRALESASRNGHFFVVKFVWSFIDTKRRTNALILAARKGDMNIISFLHQLGLEGTTFEALDNASTYGNIDVVKFLHSNRTEGASNQALNGSSYHGHIEIVKFLHSNRSEGASNRAIDFASANGNVEVVKFLNENRNEGFTSYALENSSLNGHLEIVKYLASCKNVCCSMSTLKMACEGGHLEIVKFLCETFTNHNYTQALIAAAKKDLEITKYILEHTPNHQPQDLIRPSVLVSAIASGHFDIFSYLIKLVNIEVIGYNYLFSNASFHSQFDVLRYLIEEVPVSQHRNVDLCINFLINQGHVECLHRFMQLHNRSVANLDISDSNFQLLCSGGHIGMVKYVALPKHFTVSNRLAALRNGHISIYFFLNSYCPVYSEREIELAIHKGYLIVLKHIVENSPKPITNLTTLIDQSKEFKFNHITNYLQNLKEIQNNKRWSMFK